jgi:organic hydroperoxide reductase OsmC/OhrA
MYHYPIKFSLRAEATPGTQNAWSSTAQADLDQPLMLAIPAEFNGPGGALSPEDLYGLAILNCFIATFKVIAEASALTFENLVATLELEADKNEQGQPWIARAHLVAKLHGVSAPEKAERLMTKASQSCLIMNSVNTQKTFQFIIG